MRWLLPVSGPPVKNKYIGSILVGISDVKVLILSLHHFKAILYASLCLLFNDLTKAACSSSFNSFGRAVVTTCKHKILDTD